MELLKVGFAMEQICRINVLQEQDVMNMAAITALLQIHGQQEPVMELTKDALCVTCVEEQGPMMKEISTA